MPAARRFSTLVTSASRKWCPYCSIKSASGWLLSITLNCLPCICNTRATTCPNRPKPTIRIGCCGTSWACLGAFFCIKGRILVFINQNNNGVSSIEPNMISKVGCKISLLSNCSLSAIFNRRKDSSPLCASRIASPMLNLPERC